MEKHIPVVCTLEAPAAGDQLAEWQAFHRLVKSWDRIPGGVRLRLPADAYHQVQDLADREQQCCRFLAISVEVDGPETVVAITSDQPEAAPVIELLAGVAS